MQSQSTPARFSACVQCGTLKRGYPSRQYKYCSVRCRGLHKRRPFAERFWAKVARLDDPTSCWIWQGSRYPFGHGISKYPDTQRTTTAHRVAWMLTYGSIPDGLWLCHACDNPPCVRPDHLFLGTPIENNADKLAKGREARGDRNGSVKSPERLPHGDNHWTHQHPEHVKRAEDNPASRLTWIQAREIRARVAAGEMQKALSAEFGVSRATLSRLISGQSWAERDRRS
jgi:hypothetical protein